MNMTRVDRDGVEFFTLNITGESGMSESGLAKLCGVSQPAISQLLGNLVISSDPPNCLKQLLGKDFELQLRGQKNARVLKAEVCAGVIEYYAFESRRKTKEALFAYRKFASMGVTAWIQSITGWQNLPSYSPRSQLSTR